MKNTNKEKPLKNILFRLTNEKVEGPSWLLQTSDNPRTRLMHNNKPIRYSMSHESPYIADQQGEVMREAIDFIQGSLVVHESKTPLLNFLRVHPQIDTTFYEVNLERMAEEELEELNLEADAMIFAKTADTEVLSTAVRILMGSDVDNMTVKEIRRDALQLAKRNPEGLLQLKSDPSFEIKDVIARSVADKHLGLRNNNTAIHYNFPDRKEKLLTVPMDQTWQEALERYLLSDEGVELYKILKKLLGV